ncbi:MAG: hypothetical protein JWR74_1323, partial [Polaromonas sp.]|nr:hypothetical protein [Polaromonas sp.]
MTWTDQALINYQSAMSTRKQPFLALFAHTAISAILMAVCAAPLGAQTQHAANEAKARQAWPTRPIRILVGFPGGSTPDMSARTLAEPLSRVLGQPVIVENRVGASGNIAADLIAKAVDDHTLGVVINGNLTSA